MPTHEHTFWIHPVAPDQADGDLAGIYAEIRKNSDHDRVANFWQAQGLDPRGLEALFAYYRTLMSTPAPLTEAQAQMIALVVSATNGCGYCVAHRGPALAKALGDEALARAVAMDYREADLSARDRVMLDYAVALTCEPSERKNEDVERIREYGFDDAAILKVTEITACYNLVNRIVSALGVPLEAGTEAWEFGSQK